MIEFGSFCLKQDSWFCFNGESPRAHLHVGGDVAVDVFDVNQPSLPTPFFILFLCLVSSLVALSSVFQYRNYLDNSLFSHSVLPVLFLLYWSFQLSISL